jgi:hypothetical protein
MTPASAITGHSEIIDAHGTAYAPTQSRLPPLAILLGIAGIIPFILCALAAIRGDAANDPFSLLALLAYGAVVLSFLGGVHWGFVIEGAKQPAERLRLALGVVPGLLGWGAVLLSIAGEGVLGLCLLIAGFVGAIIIESRAHGSGLVPRAYLVLRWSLTVVVVAMLVTVLVLRLSGASVDI